ncbi:MAG: TIGR02678 family protein [Kineosporiaceae bacterium]
MTRRVVDRSAVDRSEGERDAHRAAERRRAMRALLRRPLLHGQGDQADDATREDLRLLRRHREEVAREFAQGLGYRLLVEASGARLVKAGLGRDASRPLRRPARGSALGRVFTPRGYALLTLVLAVLTRAPGQLLLDELVPLVRSAAADAGVDVDLDALPDRRDLAAALLVLVQLGVLTERDGDLEGWADSPGTQSLLEVSRDRLRLLLAVPLAGARGPEDLLDAPDLPSAAGGARIAVRRRLAESPVLSLTDLDDEQAAWWSRNRHREAEWFADRLGLDVELRAEGALAVDPDEELTDVAFPGTGSARHYALLLLAQVVDDARDDARRHETVDRVWWPVPRAAVDQAHGAVHEARRAGLRKEHREDPAALLREVEGLLSAVGLIRVDPPAPGGPSGSGAPGGWRVHAAAARYAPQVEPASTVAEQLW